MIAHSPATEPRSEEFAGSGREQRMVAELEEMQLRVAAQDRLIEAMLAENADIHALRRRNHQLEQYMGKLLSPAPVQFALRVRRRILRRPDPDS